MNATPTSLDLRDPALARVLTKQTRCAASRYGVDQEDIAQEAALAAFLRWDTFDPARGSRTQWIKGVVRVSAKVYLRRQRRDRTVLCDPVPVGVVDVDQVQSVMLRRVLARLGKRDRELITLLASGHTLREAAEMQQHPCTNLYQRLVRIRKMFGDLGLFAE